MVGFGNDHRSQYTVNDFTLISNFESCNGWMKTHWVWDLVEYQHGCARCTDMWRVSLIPEQTWKNGEKYRYYSQRRDCLSEMTCKPSRVCEWDTWVMSLLCWSGLFLRLKIEQGVTGVVRYYSFPFVLFCQVTPLGVGSPDREPKGCMSHLRTAQIENYSIHM